MNKDYIDEFIDDLSGDAEDESESEFHPPIIVNRDELVDDHTESVITNTITDYEFVRKNLKQIIETNVKAIERLTKIASESESPRTFEVMSDYMKQMVSANESLMKLHKEVKDITNDNGSKSENSIESQGETNNYFVGSTEELLDIIEARQKIKNISPPIEGEVEDD